MSRESVRHSVRAAETGGVVSGISALVVGIYLTSVAAVSTAFGLNGALSIGEIIAVLGLSQLILGPLQDVATVWPAIRRGRASAERIQTMLDAPPVLIGTDPVNGSGSAPLVIERLRAPGLDGISLAVPPGAIHGIAFADAVGAESLVAILSGLVSPTSGRLIALGSNLAMADPDSMRGAMMVWPHGAVPAGDTIGDLLGIAERGPKVEGSIAAAAADDVIDRMPHGLATLVTERAASLSGGERQRIGLARALLERSPILVLHEPTSAVDAVTETRIARGIARDRSDLTTVLITTSPTLLDLCDSVTLVADGIVRDSGTHAELMCASERYRFVVAQ